FAASTARDTDFFARLVDEDPDGAAIDVCYGMIRARHRKSLEEEHFLVPGEVTQFEITLGATACRFMAGHRIRIEITSSDFPNHDRNHNTGKNDLKDAQLLVAHQQIFHSTEYPSRLLLPVDTTA
ncbi:MAG: CocE/NonD family hydrolase, partial [Candidatus Latescibacteria bacterium]|nr:CocE/NonD family hydrolase [Candidatus Latescibacterota bacterium]